MAIVHTVTYLSFVKIFLFFLLVLSIASTIKSIITGDMKSDHYFDWYFYPFKISSIHMVMYYYGGNFFGYHHFPYDTFFCRS